MKLSLQRAVPCAVGSVTAAVILLSITPLAALWVVTSTDLSNAATKAIDDLTGVHRSATTARVVLNVSATLAQPSVVASTLKVQLPLEILEGSASDNLDLLHRFLVPLRLRYPYLCSISVAWTNSEGSHMFMQTGCAVSTAEPAYCVLDTSVSTDLVCKKYRRQSVATSSVVRTVTNYSVVGAPCISAFFASDALRPSDVALLVADTRVLVAGSPGIAMASGDTGKHFEMIDCPNETQMHRISLLDFAHVDRSAFTTPRRSSISEVNILERETKRVSETLAAFSKYVPIVVVQSLIKKKLRPSVGVREMQATILFLDVVNFTAAMDTRGADTLICILEEMFDTMTNILEDNGAIIDKYIGDSIMALWGCPEAVDKAELRSCKAVCEMHSSLANMNERFIKTYGLEMGIRPQRIVF
eukprot:m51a1_g1330 putative adenylate guanylate cyclase (415) ;mRNA; r:286291-290206